MARNPRRNDRRPGSFKVNLRTGRWADFAHGDQGSDIISLYAYLHGLSQIEAAREIARDLSLTGGNRLPGRALVGGPSAACRATCREGTVRHCRTEIGVPPGPCGPRESILAVRWVSGISSLADAALPCRPTAPCDCCAFIRTARSAGTMTAARSACPAIR